eukprot:Blabericola_migrator_1__7491@NODE_3825_length_1484_cov_58_305575_g2372_i0_p3_GENE_NODE_3825_length_1484_cov_58_305575_g2372_i0NODE_3825_length_1484_cov_58_305575_g2372_i0_p3_ORF_typecomplete_len146_score19_23_NODE_3825_length_1484_cov_58_305575_g2372_i0148585
MQPPLLRGVAPQGNMSTVPQPAPRPARPLMQQSNQFVKRLALAGIYMKQATDPSLASEGVKETLIQFFGYLTDRVLDYTFTTLTRNAPQSIEEVRQFCSDHLGYDAPAHKANSQSLNLSIHRRKGQRFKRLGKGGISVLQKKKAT